MNNRSKFRRLLIGSTYTWMVVLAIIPYLILLGASFVDQSEQANGNFSLSLANYAHLLSPEIFSMAVDSIVMAAVAALLCLLVGYPFAYILAQAPAKVQPLLLLLVMIPFWTNSLIRTYALVMMLKADGIINTILLGLHLIDTPLQLMYTPLAVFIGLVYTLLPFMILPLYAALKALDPRLLEAGRDLGASRLHTFFRITVPLTMPGIIAGTMLVFLPALGMFYVADVLGGSKAMLLGNFIRDQFLIYRNIPMGSAASVTMTVAMGLMLLLHHLAARRLGKESMQ